MRGYWPLGEEIEHKASQWQITDTSGNYGSPIYDSGTDTSNLTSAAIPSSTLDESTTYYWRVRHQDMEGDWSSWSTETSFTTLSSGALSVDIVDSGGTTVSTLQCLWIQQNFRLVLKQPQELSAQVAKR